MPTNRSCSLGRSTQTKNDAQYQDQEEDTLPGMQEDGKPITVEALAGIGKHQVGRKPAQEAPGLV